jgi:arylsulfatase A-like enzyme
MGLFDEKISRRETLCRAAATTAMAAISPILQATSCLAATRQRPNIIFVLTDDHRYDCLGIAGHPFLKTPSMDRLAREGVLFENAFVTTSLCSPSRASFLTGQYASRHGVKNNFTPWREENVTFLELLKKQGYDTAFIGKWHMPGGGLPRLRGVDLFVSFTKKEGQGDYYNCPLFVNHRQVPNRRPYITEELTDYAIDYVTAKRDRPFCLYLSHKAVHHDWRPPAHLRGIYKNAKITCFPPESDRWNTWSGNNWLEGTLGPMDTIYRRYCECITSVDEQLGRIIDALERKNVLDNTLIVYAGDNGYIWGEHRLYAKHWPYEESIRIPLIVRYPGLVQDPGRRATQMVLNIDLAPTLLEAAGAQVPGMFQGESFLPVLRSGKTPGRQSWMYELYKDFPFGGRVPPNRAVRTDRYKYIEWESCRAPELYDLRDDPREMKNLLLKSGLNTPVKQLQSELNRLKKRYAGI